MTTGVRSDWIGGCSKKLYCHITKMEQMRELLNAMQEMMGTQICSVASWMDIHQAKIDGNQAEMLARTKAKMDSHQERMEVKMDAWLEELKAWRKETMAYQEVMEACLESKEPTSIEIEAIAVHEEVSKEVH